MKWSLFSVAQLSSSGTFKKHDCQPLGVSDEDITAASRVDSLVM